MLRDLMTTTIVHMICRSSIYRAGVAGSGMSAREVGCSGWNLMLAALSGRAAVTAIFAETPIKPLLQSSTCLVHVHGPCPLLINSFTLNGDLNGGSFYRAVSWNGFARPG